MNPLPWSSNIETDPAGRWTQIRWTLSAEGLSAAFSAAVGGPPVRSAALDDLKSVLLLSDVVTVDDTPLAMNIFAHRAGPHTLIVESRLTSDQPLDGTLQASLSWGDRALTTLVDTAHRAIFDDVRVEALIDVGTGQARADLHFTVNRPSAQSE